jgi:hypothetical protein
MHLPKQRSKRKIIFFLKNEIEAEKMGWTVRDRIALALAMFPKNILKYINWLFYFTGIQLYNTNARC